MTLPTHVAAGVILSRLHPVVAIILSFISHPILDIYLIEYQFEWRKGKVFIRHSLWMLWCIAVLIFFWQTATWVGRLCIFSSLFPDIIELVNIIYNSFRGHDVLAQGDHIMCWHDKKDGNCKAMSFIKTFAIEILSVAIACWVFFFLGK